MVKNAKSVVFLLVLAHPSFGAGMAHNDNFIVLTKSTGVSESADVLVNEVLQQAERFRQEISQEWLGEELPPGVGAAVISVRISAEKDEGLTWAKGRAGGKYHNVYLVTQRDLAVGSTLAHEMVHVVLNTEFADPNRLAMWVEEGIASRYDDDERKIKRAKILRWFARTGNWPQLQTVLDAEQIHTSDQQSYAVAASLAEFFVARGGKTKFVEFAAAAGREGWESALSRFYEIGGIAELQHSWEQWESRRFAEPLAAVPSKFRGR